MNTGIPTWVFGLLLSLVGMQVFGQSSNNEYLNSLRNEAAGLKLDGGTAADLNNAETAPPSSFGIGPLSDEHAGAIQELNSGLTLKQFETLLQHNYMGSYLFFKRLSEAQKNEVFEFYQRNPDPKRVRQKILEVNKN